MNALAILMTVHNRKEKTLNCLKHIFNQLPIKNWEIDVYMTDDGCIDGTPEEVAKRYPDVKIIRGDGNLFWNRGMVKAWIAASNTREYDAYLWLNDDTTLLENSINTLCTSHSLKPECILVGATKASNSNTITYGGLYSYANHTLIAPNGTLQKCGLFTGNIVLVPNSVYLKLGTLDNYYSHALGDTDYALMANENHIDSYVCQEILGICDRNLSKPKWMRPEISLKERINNLFSPLSYFPPKEYFHLKKKHWGYINAVASICSITIRLLFPKYYK